MEKKAVTVNLYDYLDYRHYLNDWFSAHKVAGIPMSYRLFSKRAGLKSTNFMMLVMKGKRNLSQDSIKKVVKGLKLNKEESQFFENLVLFNQAEDHEERNRFYSKLVKSRKFSQLKPLQKSRHEYAAKWYHAVVREMILSPEFDGTAFWIASKIFPHVSTQDIEKSLKLLEKLGFIQKNDEGKWEQTESLVTTGAEIHSVSVFNYHLNMLKMSGTILEHIDPDKRDISSLTLGVNKGKLPLIKKKLQDFRKELLELVSEDFEPTDVIQVNMQMFPFTKGEK